MKLRIALWLLLIPLTASEAVPCGPRWRALFRSMAQGWEGKVAKMLEGRKVTFATEAERRRLVGAMESALDAFRNAHYDQTIALLQKSGVKLDLNDPLVIEDPESIPDSYTKWLDFAMSSQLIVAMRVNQTVLVCVSQMQVKDPATGALRPLSMENPKEKQALEWMAREHLEEYWHALQFWSEDKSITPLAIEFEKWSLRNPGFIAWFDRAGRQALPLIYQPVSDAQWNALSTKEKKRRRKSMRETILSEVDVGAMFLLLGGPSDGVEVTENRPHYGRYFLEEMIKEEKGR